MEFSEQQPHIQESPHLPIEEMEDSILYLGVKLAKAKDSTGGFVPERDKLESFYVNDKYALELQQKIAIAMGLGQNLLIEGGTAIGKTTTVAKMCAELGYELHYVNLNAQTDVENMMGRYIPNIRREKEIDPEYEFADGSVTSGLRPEKGKIKVIVLDEVNATHPGTLKRLNEVLNAVEQGGTVVLTEDAAEQIRVSKETTKVIALMNPSGQGYLGVNPLSKELINRFVYQKEVNELPRESFGFRRKARRGIGDTTQEMPVSSFIPTLDNVLSMEQYNEIAGIDEIEAKYEEFHFSAKKLLEVKKLAEDQIQLFLYDDQRESDRVTDFVLRHYNGDINETFQQALRYYYANKLESEIDRKKLDELIKLVEYTPKVVESKRRGSERSEAIKTQQAQEIIDNGENFWPFETLTQETLQKQHEAQRLAYLEVGLIKTLSSDKEGFELNGQEYLFPTIQELQEHLTQDPESLNFFQEKIKQGFTEIQISPFYLPLNQIIQTVDKKIVEHNKGSVKAKPAFRSDSWQQADLETTLKYFISLNSQDNIDENSGQTKETIISQYQENPANHPYLLNGYIISLVEPGDEVYHSSDNPQELAGRTPLKGGQTGINYLKQFEDPDSPYFDELTITPEEWLSLFVQKLYEKYLKDGKDIEESGSDIFETKGWCWFVNCLLSSGLLPYADWIPVNRRINLNERKTDVSSSLFAPRPAVRRKS